MKAPRVRFPLVAALIAGIGAVIAFAMPAGAAVSLQSQSPPTAAVSLAKTATLDANGAVIFSPVNWTCPRNVTYGELDIRVTEAVGNDLAQGTVSISINLCTGAVQRQTVAVVPTQHPYRKGVAFGQAWLYVCNNYGCSQFLDEHNVRIR